MNENNIGFRLKRISNIMKRNLEYKGPFKNKVTGNHIYILGYIFINKEKDIFQKDIEIEFNIRRSTVSEILDNMENNNLIERIPVNYDARLKKIVLTDKGFMVYNESFKHIIDFENVLKININKKDLKIFFSVLEQIENNIQFFFRRNYDKEDN